MKKKKPCTKCGTNKPLSEFPKDSRMMDGRRSDCKKCKYGETKKWRMANRDEVLKYHRAYSRTWIKKVMKDPKRAAARRAYVNASVKRWYRRQKALDIRV